MHGTAAPNSISCLPPRARGQLREPSVLVHHSSSLRERHPASILPSIHPSLPPSVRARSVAVLLITDKHRVFASATITCESVTCLPGPAYSHSHSHSHAWTRAGSRARTRPEARPQQLCARGVESGWPDGEGGESQILSSRSTRQAGRLAPQSPASSALGGSFLRRSTYLSQIDRHRGDETCMQHAMHTTLYTCVGLGMQRKRDSTVLERGSEHGEGSSSGRRQRRGTGTVPCTCREGSGPGSRRRSLRRVMSRTQHIRSPASPLLRPAALLLVSSSSKQQQRQCTRVCA